MKNKQALIDKRKSLHDANQAAFDLADKETRAITADEKKAIDARSAEISALDDTITTHDAHELQSRKPKESAGRSTVADAINPDPVSKTWAIPATARRHTAAALKARGFTGDDPHRDAYTAGQFVAGHLFGNAKSRKWCDEHGIQVGAAGLAESDNTTGGVLVIPEYENAIIELRQQFGVFRQNAKRVPMAAETKQVPRKVSALTAYPVAEGGSGTESQSGWDSVLLVARTWQVNTRMSMEISEDAIIDLAADTASDMAKAFAYSEDLAGFNGTGALATYGGINGVFNKINDGTHSASIYTAAAGGTAFNTLILKDFEGVIGQYPLYAAVSPKWYISQAGYWASMARLKDAAGGNTTADIIAGPGNYTFLGFPVVISQVLNSTLTAQTSTLVAGFGDLGATAMFGDRRGIVMQTNPYEYMSTRQISLYGTERFDINVCNLGDASAAGEFSTVGPFIALKTASS